MVEKIDLKAIQAQIDTATQSELDVIIATSKEVLDEFKKRGYAYSLEERVEKGMKAMHTLVLAEAKLYNKGALYKFFKKLQLAIVFMSIAGRK